MGQKISIKDVIAITRDRLNNICVPVGLLHSIGNQIAECADNLTAILTAMESEVKPDGNKDGTENRSDKACESKEP